MAGSCRSAAMRGRGTIGRSGSRTCSSSVSSMNGISAPFIVIQPGRGLFHLDLAALWEYRELLYFLVWRDLKVRDKQTVIGAGWGLLQPLVTMVVFTVVFAGFAKMPSDGLPYPIFAYTALLPWTYF